MYAMKFGYFIEVLITHTYTHTKARTDARTHTHIYEHRTYQFMGLILSH